MSYVFSMLSKPASPWKGKGHEPEIGDLQLRPRTGRIITIFIKLSASPLRRTYKQGSLTSLRGPLPGLGDGASQDASQDGASQDGVTHLLSILVVPQENQDRTGCSHPATDGTGLKIFIKSCCASPLKTDTSGTKNPDHLHPDHENNSSLIASLKCLSEATY